MAYLTPLPPGVTDDDEVKTTGGPNQPGRGRDSKHWQKNNVGRMHAHGPGACIHYWDQFDLDATGQRYREVDITLVAVTGGWSFQEKYADYIPWIPEFADEWMTFTNLLPVARGQDVSDYDVVSLRAPNHAQGQLIPEWDSWDTGSVYYPDAYDVGIHLRVVPTRGGLQHTFQVDASVLPTLLADLEIASEVAAAPSLEIVIDGSAWDRSSKTITTTAVQVRAPDGELTHLRAFRAWDSAGESISIQAYFEKRGNRFYFVKVIPLAWLQDPERVFPIYSDATISPVAETSDGWNEPSANTTWATIRSATTTPGVGTQSSRPYVNFATPNYTMMRAVSAHDCSSLPTSPTISAASLFLYMTALTDNGGLLTVTECTRADPLSHVGGDYDDCTLNSPTEWASRYDLGSVTTSAFNEIALNANGIAAIPDDDYIDFMFRMDRDVDDSAPTVRDQVWWQCVEQANDPYLYITYTTGSAFVPRALVY